MSTLNYWLGKLARCQLFGHGNKPLYVQVPDPDPMRIGNVLREVADVRHESERVVIILK